MKSWLALSTLVVFATPASSTLLVVPVPALQGTYVSAYPSVGERTTPIQLPALPSVIHSVKVRLRGTCTFANYSCDGSQGYGPPQPVPIDFFAGVYEGDLMAPTGWAEGDGYVNVPGAFDETRTLEHYPGPTDWSFLLDGSATLRLGAWGVPAIMECNLVGPPDQTTFDVVELLVDGEFPTPAATTSWGKVKSIYR